MSIEDLEIHQPADTSSRTQYLPHRASLGDGLDSLLQRGKAVLRGGSLPSLLDNSWHPNEDEDDDDSPEGDTNHKEQEKVIINVSVEPN